MRFLKYFLGLLSIILIAGLVTVWVMERNTPPTHPALVNADLPPIIPVRDFYADRRATWGHAVSKSGTYVAYGGTKLTEQYVFIRDIASGKIVADIKEWDDFFWDPHMDALRVMLDGRMWRVDPNNPERDTWVDVTPRGFQSGYHLPFFPQSPDARQVVLSYGRQANVADLYTVDQDGQNKELLVENEGRTQYWVLNAQNQPVLRADRPEDNDQIVEFFIRPSEDQDWIPLFEVSLNERFYFLEVSADRTYAYAVSSRGRDKAAIVRISLNDGTETVLFENPKADAGWVINFDPFDGDLDGVLDGYDFATFVPLTDRGQKLANLIAELPKEFVVDSANWTIDGRYVYAHISENALGYQFYLFDLEAETMTALDRWDFSDRYAESLSAPKLIEFQARDGMTLNGILTQAKGVSEAAPVLVHVHGGPASLQRLEYHHWFQFLANRGYSVFSINYRGSAGFGKQIQAAGFGQFGRAMQDDVVDAAQWLIDQGIADPNAIGVIGGSYGGYASALAMTRDPEMFAAAVSEVAMLDVAYQSQHPPYFWGLNLYTFERYFGNADAPEDVEVMREFSPINQIENLQGPVLLIAGRQDRVVGFEQSERFLQTAQDLGKDVEMLDFDDEGHGNFSWTNKVERARTVEDFLADHLGGRSGGWDLIEAAIPYLD